jgi:hypothetical protein
LVYRLFGFSMTTWEDVVRPASMRALMRWMQEARELAAANLAEVEVTKLIRGKCAACGHVHSRGACKRCDCPEQVTTYNKVERKPGAVESVLSHLLRYTDPESQAEKPYDPWSKLVEIQEEGLRGKRAETWEWEWLEGELGALPILGIGNCDLDEAIAYACADADWTGRVAMELEVRRGGERWKVEKRDWDTEQ